MRAEREVYRFRPGLTLAIQGSHAARRHFKAEYGGASAAGDDPQIDVDVRFGALSPSGRTTAVVRGGHKTVRWAVTLGPAFGAPLNAWVRLRGRPHGFGLSLVQSFFVEPLLSMAAARSGHVLLPAAALADGDGALVVMGPSRSGKTSLMVRALAAGRQVLGDDQVLIDPSGCCCPFPRRSRVYPDLMETAPDAYARLGGLSRAALTGRRWASRASGGFIAPALALDRSQLGEEKGPPDALAIRRVAMIERRGESDGLRVRHVDTEQAVHGALNLLDAQRRHLPHAHPDWADAVSSARTLETGHLSHALGELSVEQISVPVDWDAATAVEAVEQQLGIKA